MPEKRAAAVPPPDLCHGGGITVRLPACPAGSAMRPKRKWASVCGSAISHRRQTELKKSCGKKRGCVRCPGMEMEILEYCRFH